MLVEFSIVPIGVGTSLSEYIAEVLKLVEESGLPYKINPMGTCVEGDWKDVMALIKKCHRIVMKKADRVIINIKIDDRKDKPLHLDDKIKSVEKRLGKKLKK